MSNKSMKQWAGNIGRWCANAVIVFVGLIMFWVSTVGVGVTIAGDLLKMTFMSSDDPKRQMLLWAAGIFLAGVSVVNWFWIKIIQRARKRQKAIKWE